jgi:hypothetical protein
LNTQQKNENKLKIIYNILKMNVKTFKKTYKKSTSRRKVSPESEANQQELVIKYLRLAYPNLLYCASAGGMRTSYLQAIKMKRTGYVKGFPDLFIYEPRNEYNGLAIEMKKEKGGVASPEQKRWQEQLRNRGYASYICKGSEEAIKVIDEYFNE